MDLVHKATNIIDHNRGAVVGALVLIASLYAAGCAAWDGKVASSSTGDLVNSQQRQVEYNNDIKDIKSRMRVAEAKADEAVRDLRLIQEDADDIEVDYDFDLDSINNEIAARKDGIGKIADLVTTQIPASSWILPWLTIGSTAVAGGVTYDNRRKDKIIKKKEVPVG